MIAIKNTWHDCRLKILRKGSTCLVEVSVAHHITHEPGQFISMQLFLNDKVYKRFYSILKSSESNGRQLFTLAISTCGVVSRAINDALLHEAKIFHKAIGLLTLSQKDALDSLIFCSTNTGIAPYCSYVNSLQLQQYMKDNKHMTVQFLHGIRTIEDNFLVEEMALNLYRSRVSIHVFVSSNSSARAVSRYNIQYHYGQRLTDSAGLDIIRKGSVEKTGFCYLCGNPRMIEQAEKYLTETNPSFIIKKEKFITLDGK